MQVMNNSINFSNQMKSKQNVQKIAFGNSGTEYKNPVSMKAEYAVAIIEGAAGSAIVGGIAGFLAHMVKATKATEGTPVSRKFGAILGAAVGLGTFIITVGPKLYKTAVTGFVKQQEMNVYSRQKSAETTLTEKIDQQAKNEDVPLDQAVSTYSKFAMAKNGRGVGIASLN